MSEQDTHPKQTSSQSSDRSGDDSVPQVLVTDDDRTVLAFIERALQSVANVTTAETGQRAAELIKSRSFETVLLDIGLPDRSGLDVFVEIRNHDRRLPVIFMTIEATSSTAIEAMQLGAFDYLAKPLSLQPLRDLVSSALAQRRLTSTPVALAAEEDDADDERELFVGCSKPMLEVFKSIGRVAKQDIPVLIRGESGTGKELVARALYQYSHRCDGPFLAVNCAALPDNLLESELFGHERGAFTGADRRRIGKFEQCNGGTLFLDEIGDMASVVQAEVLRVLHEQRFERVGGNHELTTDARIVAATNRNLETMVATGRFREDLLYRLNGVTIGLPPLRERREDIPLLIQHFLGQAKRELHKPDLQGISPEALRVLTEYDWPGNVRQLRAVIRRCVLNASMPVVVPEMLPPEIFAARGEDWQSDDGDAIPQISLTTSAEQDDSGPGAQRSGREGPGGEGPGAEGAELPAIVDRLIAERSTDVYSECIAYAERYVILRVLRVTGGNQSQAAEMLGITRGKLRDRIAAFGIVLDSEIKISD